MRTDSDPGIGTSDVNTCRATGGAPGYADAREVIIATRPGSQIIVYFSFPAGATKRETLLGTMLGCRTYSAFLLSGSPQGLMLMSNSRLFC
jgi:hypothetical protein